MSEMQAGREFDALIAEQVMNWKEEWAGIDRTVPPYSTDIAAAWQVLEKVAPMFRRFEVHAVDGSYVAQIEGGTCDVDCNYIADATADTAPLAICRAALAALEATCAK